MASDPYTVLGAKPDLRDDLGVNDEAVAVVLDLVDQIYGLRRLVRELLDRSR